MKKELKKQLMTGLAAVALVSPLVLGGINGNNNVHAAGTPQVLASANNQNANSQAQPTSTAQSNSQSAQGNKPTKTVTPQQFKQLLAKQFAKQAAAQKKQLARELKGSMDIFVAQGNEVYTAKAKGTKLFPTTMKKYMSVKKFKKIMVSKVNRLRYDALRYRATRNKKYLRNFQKNSKYARVGRIPTQKQMAKIQQQQAKAQADKAKKQKSLSNKGVKKSNVKKSNRKRSNKQAIRHHRRNKVTRKSHRKPRRTRRNKKSRRNRRAMHSQINGRIKRSRYQARQNRKKRARSATTFVKNNRVYLKSEFRRGTRKKAKRSQFANGPMLDNVKTLFDRYRPNDRRAVIPKHYRIIPNNTTWLVGRHTNNINKINHIKDAYYYNKQYRGWSNIGYNN